MKSSFHDLFFFKMLSTTTILLVDISLQLDSGQKV